MRTACASLYARIASVASLILTLFLGGWGGVTAAPITIAAGYDHFETFPGGTAFGIALPPGFLNVSGSPSDSFGPSVVFFQGYPPGLPSFPLTPILVPTGPGCHAHSAGGTHCNLAPLAPANADTVVERLAPLTLNSVGDTGTIPVEIVGLSLQSVAPIEVSFDGGSFTGFFDVFVTLNPSPPGALSVTRTGESQLSIVTAAPMGANVTFVFVNTIDPGIFNFVAIDGVVQLIEPWEFHLVPEPGTLGLCLVGVGLALAWRHARSCRRS